MKVEMDMPELPEGYEYTGDYRTPQVGELFEDKGRVETSKIYNRYCNYPIVRKKRLTFADLKMGEWFRFKGGAEQRSECNHQKISRMTYFCAVDSEVKEEPPDDTPVVRLKATFTEDK